MTIARLLFLAQKHDLPYRLATTVVTLVMLLFVGDDARAEICQPPETPSISISYTGPDANRLVLFKFT